MKWAEKNEVVDYIIECYAGTEGSLKKRQFIWEDESGDIVIGNTRAFADHCRVKFGLPPRKSSWSQIHEVLRAVGEVAQVHGPRVNHPRRKFKNPEPEVRVLKRKANR